VDKHSGPILSRLWAKIHEVSRQCRGSVVVSNALAHCLSHVSFRR